MKVVGWIARFLAWTVFGATALVAAVCFVVYVPFVQQFAADRASDILAEKTGMHITVERFRVRFPLSISLRGVTVVMPPRPEIDSLASGASGSPVSAGQTGTPDDAAGRPAGTVSGDTLLTARRLTTGVGVSLRRLRNRSVRVRRIVVDGADVRIPFVAGGVDTLPPKPLGDTILPVIPWNFEVRRLTISDSRLAAGGYAFDSLALTAQNIVYRQGNLAVSLGGLSFIEQRLGLVLESASGELALVQRLDTLSTPDPASGDSTISAPAPPLGAEMRASNETRNDRRRKRRSRTRAENSTPQSSAREALRASEEAMMAKITGASPGFYLTDLKITTPNSNLSIDAEAGIGVVRMEDAAPVSLTISGRIGAQDLVPLLTIPDFARSPSAPPPPFRGAENVLKDIRRVDLDAALAGTLRAISIDRLTATIPEKLELSAHGNVQNITRATDIQGSATLSARLHDVAFAKKFLPDTLLRQRIGLPPEMTLKAAGEFSTTDFTLREMNLATASGELDARGSLDLRRQTYSAVLRARNFPLGEFLPRDSLGVVTAFATVRGNGFNPAGGINARGRVNVRRFDYKTYNLHDVSLIAAVRAGGRFNAQISSANELLTMDLEAEGSLAHDSTTVSVRTGDLVLDLSAPLPVDALVSGAAHAGDEVRKQLAARHFNADSLQSAFPAMKLTAHAGRANFLSEMAHDSGVDFRNFEASVSTLPGAPFDISARMTNFQTGKLALDTISLAARRNATLMDYSLRMVGQRRASNIVGDHLGLIALSGDVGGNILNLNVLQQNQKHETGFDFGVQASLADSLLHLRMTPLDPTLAYEKWTVDGAGLGGDWLETGVDGTLRADLQLTGQAPGEYINIVSATLADTPDAALTLDAGGLDIARALDLFPTAPKALGGRFFSNITFGLLRDGDQRNIVAKGSLGVEDFSYQKRRVASIEADVDFQSDVSGQMALTAEMTLDDNVALTAGGTYSSQGMDFAIRIPDLPLDLVEGFLPAEAAATLTGRLDGNVRIAGIPTAPNFTGDVGFIDGSARIGMTGTTLKISPERITLDGRRVNFNGIGLVAPNNQKLTLGGTVDVTDMGRPRADLTLGGRNFQVVRSNHIGGSQVYGTAALDANVTARGPLDALLVRGNIDIAGSTDLVYILRNRSTVKDVKQHIVEFRDFGLDSLYADLGTPDALPSLRPRVDMLVGVNIPDGVKATLSLDEVNENRVELTGGGGLSFSMNTQGDVRLTGRYTLDGGTLHYRPPMIAQKVFAVSPGSYVEWTGPAAAPEFHISATQTMDVELHYDDGMASRTEFDLSIDISGSLRAMDMRFDLAAPGNLAIQNELLSMDQEERMRQALTLLLTGQYSGAGAKSKGASFDARQQIAGFISREVNQWARNNLRGVDFSMGVDSRTSELTGRDAMNYSYSVSGSLFSDRVKVSIGGSVSDEATAQNFAGDLIDDVALEYRLTARDNMFLKLYRYNTRESILEGEVTETGGGFIMRKKINRIGDIFRRTKKKSDN